MEHTQNAADYWRDLYEAAEREPELERDTDDDDPYGVDQGSPLGWGYYWIKAPS